MFHKGLQLDEDDFKIQNEVSIFFGHKASGEVKYLEFLMYAA